ncbi:enoyl-CoA hydratase/isomerase family protein [Actinomadura luteofluorescens]|uniref:enoyl-CoA hydratase/isomerase family protein n=1 Tax=Actinomadura luteofluorescens TaxID=46163 RepID=UPI0036367D07
MYETILYSVDERIARITLNRPDARNALSDQMIGELLDAFERARADTGVRVIVLTGAGDRAFCAGADLGGLGRAQADGRSVADAGAVRDSAPSGSSRPSPGSASRSSRGWPGTPSRAASASPPPATWSSRPTTSSSPRPRSTSVSGP